MRLFLRLIRYALILAVSGILLAVIGVTVAYWLIAPGLPSVEALRDVRLQVPLRVYSADDKLIATFGETRRIPVKIANVPKQVKEAFVAVEDARFYEHPGYDWQGIARAGWLMLSTGKFKVAGGSTITQQVARNFFFSSEVSLTRKISEIFFAVRMEHELSKDEILELYLNKIFLGNRAYGVGAAAEFYYGKTLDQLSLAECAVLASIPKFPSSGNPLNRRERVLERRNYVLQRMLDNGFISAEQFKQASTEVDQSYAHEPPIEAEAPYVAEMVRQEAIKRFGNDALTEGYVIRTTLDSHMQDGANRALHDGLISYDLRHGFRGAEAHLDIHAGMQPAELDKLLALYHPIAGLVPGVVTESAEKSATVYLVDSQSVPIDLEAIDWARPYQDDSHRGAAPKKVDALLKPGDVIRLTRNADGKWKLAQLPLAQAALLALNPENGAIKAMVGGFSFGRSKFNRVTQSNRNPGSSFKPFLYAAAFDHGFTPASIINDAPLVFEDPSKPNGLWTPKNDDDKFEGPMRLREAMVLSKNLVSIRLLDAIGVHYARDYITRFGFTPEQIPESLSMALGTASVSPLTMARGYAVFANGGFLIDPYFVDSIYDRDGKEVFHAHPALACRRCAERAQDNGRVVKVDPAVAAANALGVIEPATATTTTAASSSSTTAPNLAPRVLDARVAYLIGSLMHDVVRRGTGAGAMVLKRNDLAGKTGSTNDHRDAWFNGYNADLVAATWVGFDDFTSLGRVNGVGEFGAQAALPIWIDFMRTSLQGIKEQPFEMPTGIASARIDPDTGTLASGNDTRAILEVFKSEDIAHLAANENTPTETSKQDEKAAYDVF